MSLFSQITGQDAASNAQKQAGKNSKVQGKYASLFGDAAADYELLQNMFGSAMPSFGAALNSINQSPDQKVDKFAAGANERAAQQANTTAQFLKSQGFGDGLTGGATANAFQNAATQTNQYAQQVQDPQEQLRQLFAAIQAMGGLQNLYLNPLQAFGSGAYSAPQQQQNNPLASILGLFAGGR